MWYLSCSPNGPHGHERQVTGKKYKYENLATMEPGLFIEGN